MRQHTFTTRVSANGEAAIGASFTISAELDANLDISVPAASTDFVTIFPLDVSQCRSIFISSDKDVVLHTNTLAGDNDFTIKAGIPWVWTSQDGPAFKDTASVAVATDIVTLHIVNADADNAALVKIRATVDSTV